MFTQIKVENRKRDNAVLNKTSAPDTEVVKELTEMARTIQRPY